MPGGNRTGPQGQGPMTGRRQGWCRDTAALADAPCGGPGAGRGRGRKRGWQGGAGAGSRHRWRHGLDANTGPGRLDAQTGEDERELLQRQAELLRQQLASIEDRLQQDAAPQPDSPR